MSYMSKQTGVELAKLILIGMAVQLAVIGYVLYQSYQGRVDLISSQRQGCARAKRDRLANAEGWRIAEAARRQSGDIAISRRYADIASHLEFRGHIDCGKAFPKASFLP